MNGTQQATGFVTLQLFFPSFKCRLFSLCRSLNCGRIKMHKNLFISLASNNICWILWYTCVLFKPNVWKENSVSTRWRNWMGQPNTKLEVARGQKLVR